MAGEADGCVKAGGIGCLGAIGLVIAIVVGGILKDNAAGDRVRAGEGTEEDLAQSCSTALVNAQSWSPSMRAVSGMGVLRVISRKPDATRIQCVYSDGAGRPATVTADVVCTRLEAWCARVVSVVTPQGRMIEAKSPIPRSGARHRRHARPPG